MSSQEFETVYHTYKDKIYSYVLTLLNFAKDDAMQVTADVFLYAYTYLQQHPITNIQAFLYKVAHNTAVNRLRNVTTYVSCEKQLHESGDIEHHIDNEKIDTVYRKEIVTDILQHLDERSRSILYLVYFEDKSYDEIAHIMDIQAQTIGTIIKRAKQRFLEHATTYKYATVFTS